MSAQTEAIAAVEAQQAKTAPRSAAWMAGEQLKDICRREPESAALLAEDLRIEEMSIVKAERAIKAYADSRRTGDFACVTPAEAEEVLRKFYGLPEPGAAAPPPLPVPERPRAPVDLWDFL